MKTAALGVGLGAAGLLVSAATLPGLIMLKKAVRKEKAQGISSSMAIRADELLSQLPMASLSVLASSALAAADNIKRN